MAQLAETTPRKPRRAKPADCYALIADDGAESYYASNAEALRAACLAHLDSQFSIVRIAAGKALRR
jgi:hypothetical protein